ncbi:MAG TPA: alpha/beta hydrolase [Burkholderiaceae bacterium]|nr:alpha/beta hydrolase [Burkholderiaceae bacterium]
MSLIIFSHANSFPAGCYGILFRSLRGHGHTVKAIDQLGHNPKYPVTSNWPHLVQEITDFAQNEVAKLGEPAFLVGHSLGGFLSLMVAAQHPALARGVVMLDSPVLGGWRAKTLKLAKTTTLIGALGPGKISKQRRNSWDSADAALAHFASKKAFAKWEPKVLQDYIMHCTHDDAATGKRLLNFDRTVETAIYNTLPHNLDRLLKRHPLQSPVAFIGGEESIEMQQVGMGMTKKLAKHRIQILPGTHLFPMEHPLETAAAIDTAIHSLKAS